MQAPEHVVILIGLDDKEISRAGGRIDAEVAHQSPHNEARLHARPRKNGRDHAGGGGFAMRASDGDQGPCLQQSGQEGFTLDNRNIGGQGGGHFRVVSRHSRRNEHQVSPGHLNRRMPYKYRCAQDTQLGQRRAILAI